jgi:hypothetical protein
MRYAVAVLLSVVAAVFFALTATGNFNEQTFGLTTVPASTSCALLATGASVAGMRTGLRPGDTIDARRLSAHERLRLMVPRHIAVSVGEIAFPAEARGTASSVPIGVGGRAYGGMVFAEDPHAEAFAPEELHLLRSLGTRLSAALAALRADKIRRAFEGGDLIGIAKLNAIIRTREIHAPPGFSERSTPVAPRSHRRETTLFNFRVRTAAR